jgi:hypothetical protein
LEGHTVGIGKLHIGDAALDLRGESDCFRETLPIEIRKPHETGAATCGDIFRRIVGSEEPRIVVFVERYERRDPARDTRMTGQRPVLRLEKRKPHLQLPKRRDQYDAAERVQNQCCVHGSRNPT